MLRSRIGRSARRTGAALAVLALAGCGGGMTTDDVAGNFRTLSPAKSRELVRFAEKFRACVVARGISVDPPVASSTRIALAVHERMSVEQLAGKTTPCGEKLGGPPSKASLQVRSPKLILLYLPKRCLLDPKVEAET
jgi:hypothetical protein